MCREADIPAVSQGELPVNSWRRRCTCWWTLLLHCPLGGWSSAFTATQWWGCGEGGGAAAIVKDKEEDWGHSLSKLALRGVFTSITQLLLCRAPVYQRSLPDTELKVKLGLKPVKKRKMIFYNLLWTNVSVWPLSPAALNRFVVLCTDNSPFTS